MGIDWLAGLITSALRWLASSMLGCVAFFAVHLKPCWAAAGVFLSVSCCCTAVRSMVILPPPPPVCACRVAVTPLTTTCGGGSLGTPPLRPSRRFRWGARGPSTNEVSKLVETRRMFCQLFVNRGRQDLPGGPPGGSCLLQIHARIYSFMHYFRIY